MSGRIRIKDMSWETKTKNVSGDIRNIINVSRYIQNVNMSEKVQN